MYEARADSPPPGRNWGDVIIGGGDGTDHDGDMAKRRENDKAIRHCTTLELTFLPCPTHLADPTNHAEDLIELVLMLEEW